MFIMGILRIRGDMISWMRRLSFSVRKISVSKFAFVEDVNSRGSASHEYVTTKITCTCIFVDIVHRDLKLENILLAVDPNNLEDKLYIKVSTV